MSEDINVVYVSSEEQAEEMWRKAEENKKKMEWKRTVKLMWRFAMISTVITLVVLSIFQYFAESNLVVDYVYYEYSIHGVLLKLVPSLFIETFQSRWWDLLFVPICVFILVLTYRIVFEHKQNEPVFAILGFGFLCSIAYGVWFGMVYGLLLCVGFVLFAIMGEIIVFTLVGLKKLIKATVRIVVSFQKKYITFAKLHRWLLAK
ncbi:MAG: hypothetical protein L3J07_04090 [Candidatus Magasanikbacteria bacterium]|nr:hypothetical protein [Candidatus Magasanikbacteria bacterium]